MLRLLEPREWPVHVADPSIAARIEPFFDAMSAALKDADKHARMAKVDELKASIKENEFTEEERAAWGSDIAAELKSLEKHAMRAMVIETANVPMAVPRPKTVRSNIVAGISASRPWFWPLPAWSDPSAFRLYARYAQ